MISFNGKVVYKFICIEKGFPLYNEEKRIEHIRGDRNAVEMSKTKNFYGENVICGLTNRIGIFNNNEDFILPLEEEH
jgi:hypothetical protein